MTQTSDEIVVVGHRNPDTDTVMAAMGYAWLLRERDKLPARAARAGQLSAQTIFALGRLELEAPPLLADASPRIANVARALRALPPDRPLGEAWALAASTHLATPVVDGDGAPVGLLTGTSVFAFLTDRLAAHLGTSADALAEVPFGRVLAAPCGEAIERDSARFEASARIRDVLPRVLRDERDAFLVVDDEGRYAGVCVRADLFRPPRLRLILVDHNEAGQAVAGLDEAELLEVLDHHRLANAPTHMPIAFQVDPVGSCSTLVAERAIRSGLAVPRAMAGALLSGQLSDTLVFRSPTTTTRDRVAAMQLAAWAFPDRTDPYEALLEYGAALLRAGAGLSSRTAESIVGTDVKEYNVGEVRFSVAQVEVTNLAEAEDRLAELRAALEAQAERSGLQFAVLMVTDVVVGRSRLLLGGDVRRLDGLPYPRRPDGSLDLPGVVSRKKQLLPALFGFLER
jgi:manganese-dependent inorganic pyrophosphatase